MLEVGETVERYRVEAFLGGGGLAMVYRVRHLQLGTVHALKVLMVTLPTDRARLLAEGQVQARLSHPNVVRVSDVLLVHRTPALVMELVEGPSLEHWLATGPVTVDQALALFRGIVTGVGTAHAAGLVHRDLKPSNVLIGRGYRGEPVAKVTDFGLVRLLTAESQHTSTGAAIGTPAYMAPEQVRDPSGVDVRADLWALGCILYELLCGRRAFCDEDRFTMFAAIAEGNYPNPALFAPDAPPGGLEAIRGLLVPDRERRIRSCAALWAQLWDEASIPAELTAQVPLSLAAAAPLLAPPVQSGRPPPPRPARRPAWGCLGTAAGLAGAVAASVVAVGWGRGSAPPPPVPVAAVVEPVAPSPVPVPAPEPPPRPAPEPPRPAPPPKPPAETSSTGRVAVVGDATEVWLVADAQRLPAEGAVPIGRYVVRATWTDGIERTAGRIEIRAGAETTVRCAAFVYACTEVAK